MTVKRRITVILLSITIFVFISTIFVKEEELFITNDSIKNNLNNSMAVYIEDESASAGYAKSDTIPTSGYTFNDSMSYCTVDGVKDDSITLSYDSDTQMLTVSPMTTKGTKCYLYFEEQKTLLADVIKGYNQSTRSDFSTTMTSSTTNTVYQATDDDGTTYYFAGAPTDNWVSFAGFYWRIIRVNGDGSIRLIYQGTSANTTGEGTQIGTSTFNDSYNNNMYVGYMYTSGSVHGLGTGSTIKRVLDNWYRTNIQNAGYSSYIDTNAGFCGDRSPSTNSYSSNGSGGTGTTPTYYGAYIRLYRNKMPTYSCSNSSDLYTTSSSNKGNKALTYPIGLITADEVAYAGGEYSTVNQTYYLYTGLQYWTITPSYLSESIQAGVFRLHEYGYFYDYGVHSSYGVRPVINLKADTAISGGDGTANLPFQVQTA